MLGLALSPLVGLAGSSESGVLDESVFVWGHDDPRLDDRSRPDLIEWTWVVRREPWFYLRLSGLTLLRVLRKGLELDSCLSMTASRAYVSR